jgi:membrane-associated PAP2 superfamily phosphatase
MAKFSSSPLLVFAGLSLFGLFNFAGIDFIWANFLYNLQGGEWRLQHFWLTEQVLHQGVRNLHLFALLGLVAFYLWQRLVVKQQKTSVQALGVLLLSLMLCFASIALLKRMLPTECPWDLQQFGGTQPYIGLLIARPVEMPHTQCFPAGHASIGFAWISLFFYCQRVKPNLARPALVGALTLGFVLGFVQQLRGAHFFSHDIATVMVCWFIATLVFNAETLWERWFKPRLRVAHKERSSLL